jgi:hypothetical protein
MQRYKGNITLVPEASPDSGVAPGTCPPDDDKGTCEKKKPALILPRDFQRRLSGRSSASAKLKVQEQWVASILLIQDAATVLTRSTTNTR